MESYNPVARKAQSLFHLLASVLLVTHLGCGNIGPGSSRGNLSSCPIETIDFFPLNAEPQSTQLYNDTLERFKKCYERQGGYLSIKIVGYPDLILNESLDASSHDSQIALLRAGRVSSDLSRILSIQNTDIEIQIDDGGNVFSKVALLTSPQNLPTVLDLEREWNQLIEFCPSAEVVGIANQVGAIKGLKSATGDSVWKDYYGVLITEMPHGEGGHAAAPEDVLNMFIRNPDMFVGSNVSEFGEYISRTNSAFNISNSSRRYAANPIGLVISINNYLTKRFKGILSDRATIIISAWRPEEITVSTMYSENDKGHPVSGHRKFGFRRAKRGYEFFTVGVSRTTGWLDFERLIKPGQDKAWKGMQSSLTNTIRDFSGNAVIIGSRTENIPAELIENKFCF